MKQSCQTGPRSMKRMQETACRQGARAHARSVFHSGMCHCSLNVWLKFTHQVHSPLAQKKRLLPSSCMMRWQRIRVASYMQRLPKCSRQASSVASERIFRGRVAQESGGQKKETIAQFHHLHYQYAACSRPLGHPCYSRGLMHVALSLDLEQKWMTSQRSHWKSPEPPAVQLPMPKNFKDFKSQAHLF